jgi:integrase/recombinase XerD
MTATTTLLSPEALPNPPEALVPAVMEAAPTPAPVTAADGNSIPALITAAGEKALFSFVNFFSAGIENENTRRAYLQAWREFGKWAQGRGVRLQEVQPFILAAYREELSKRYNVRSVKQHLSALRRLFDQMVVDQVIATNPAATVRGPRFSAKQGVTPILTDTETRKLFNSLDTSHVVGLRDRAILSVLVYAVARVGAVTAMQVRDFYPQGRRWTVRLHEKGGKLHEVWCHHNLEEYLHAYIEAAGIEKEKATPLFRSTAGRTKKLTENGLDRRNVYQMIKRRAAEAGITVPIGCHSFRATGITLYMENGGTIGEAQKLANHADPRTTQLYDRSGDTVSLDEIERIRF